MLKLASIGLGYGYRHTDQSSGFAHPSFKEYAIERPSIVTLNIVPSDNGDIDVASYKLTIAPVPEKITLRFSNAADITNVLSFFNGERKQSADPRGNLRTRSAGELTQPISKGDAVLAIDEHNNIRCFALAAHHINKDAPEKNFTEIGAILCDVGGFRLAELAISMLALDQSRSPESKNKIHARVAPDNIAPNKIFSSKLGWETVVNESQRQDLFDTQYQNLPPQERVDRIWYAFSDKAFKTAENIVNTHLSSGVLHHSHSKHTIPTTIQRENTPPPQNKNENSSTNNVLVWPYNMD